MNAKTLSIICIGFVLLVGCTLPSTPVPPTPTPLAFPTSTLFIAAQPPSSQALTPGAVITPAPGATVSPAGNPSSICNDPQVTALIDSFKSAILNSNGQALSSLVSPGRGMTVAFFRGGRAITYDQNHAKFLFESTYQVDWGPQPGSGDAKSGSFHEVVVPKLKESFNQQYELHCNELSHGGATYDLKWPYQGEFYSIYFPGTQPNSQDWHTWVIGIEYVNGKPYIYALTQFFWEP